MKLYIGMGDARLSERFALGMSMLLALGIALYSAYSMVIDVFVEFSAPGLVLDLVFLLLASYLMRGSYGAYRKVTLEAALDREFREAVLTRFEPVLREIAEHQVDVEALQKRLDALDARLNRASAAHGGMPRFFLRALFLSLITLGSILFINLNISYTGAYLILFLFLLWWWAITDEFGLFDDINAYIFVVSPLVVVPVASIVLMAFLNVFYMLMALYFGLLMYIVVYYSLASYISTGRLPFRIPSELSMGKKRGFLRKIKKRFYRG